MFGKIISTIVAEPLQVRILKNPPHSVFRCENEVRIVISIPVMDVSNASTPLLLYPDNHRLYMTLSKVTDGISQVQFEHVRVLVLENVPEGKTTLVDTAFKENGARLVEILEDEYETIDRVIITHGDHGHHGGLGDVMDAFDPQLVMPADESKLYEHLEEEGYDFEPHIRYEDGDVLDGNIRVIQIPGHTEATSALLLEDRGILISGDTVDGSDRGGLPPGYLLPPPALFNDDHESAELNLYNLLKYDFHTVLVFHGTHVFEDPKQKLDDFLVEREWNEWDPRTE